MSIYCNTDEAAKEQVGSIVMPDGLGANGANQSHAVSLRQMQLVELFRLRFWQFWLAYNAVVCWEKGGIGDASSYRLAESLRRCNLYNETSP